MARNTHHATSRGSRWSRYRFDDDDDEEGEEDDDGDDNDGDFTVVTVDDTWRYVDEWRDTDDLAVEFGPIPLADGELLPEGALDEETPDKQRLTEASGNEGASYERSYHRAAVVLWRRDRYAEVLLQAGVVAGLPYLGQLTAGGEPTRREAVDLAKRMVTAWAADTRRWANHSHGAGVPEAVHRRQMLASLTELGAAALLEKFITVAVIPDYDGSENAALVTAASLLSGAKAATVFSAMVSARMPDHPCECAEFLLALSGDSSRCYPRVAESAVAALDRIRVPDETPKALHWEFDKSPRSLDPQFLENVLRGLQRFASGEHCIAAAARMAARPDAFSPVTIVVPALERTRVANGSNVGAFDSSVRDLWASCAEFLLRRSATPPPPPPDWRLAVKLTCSCPDCRELQRFARDPIAQVHRFRVKKERRQHLHDAIDKHQLDMTHVTERVGSPQTLVCTKDRRSFDWRVKQYGDEIAAMRTLVRLARGSVVATELSLRMQKAVKLAAT